MFDSSPAPFTLVVALIIVISVTTSNWKLCKVFLF